MRGEGTKHQSHLPPWTTGCFRLTGHPGDREGHLLLGQTAWSCRDGDSHRSPGQGEDPKLLTLGVRLAKPDEIPFDRDKGKLDCVNINAQKKAVFPPLKIGDHTRVLFYL